MNVSRKFTRQAVFFHDLCVKKFQEHYPAAGVALLLDKLNNATEIPGELANIVMARSLAPSKYDHSRYFLLKEKCGMLILAPFSSKRGTATFTWGVPTYYQFTEEQKRLIKKLYP